MKIIQSKQLHPPRKIKVSWFSWQITSGGVQLFGMDLADYLGLGAALWYGGEMAIRGIMFVSEQEVGTLEAEIIDGEMWITVNRCSGSDGESICLGETGWGDLVIMIDYLKAINAGRDIKWDQ